MFFVMRGFQITNDAMLQAEAPLRRPLSPNQPMWLVHIDSWNSPGPQKSIDLIPQDNQYQHRRDRRPAELHPDSSRPAVLITPNNTIFT